MNDYQTLVVNLYGGPGAGKTTLAHALVADLAKAGVLTEYVPEYAKELIWQGDRSLLDGSVTNQRKVTGEQWNRIKRMLGKVECIVTDSPVTLGMIYADKSDADYKAFCDEVEGWSKETRSFNVFVHRRDDYDQRGRKHTLAESAEADRAIKELITPMGYIHYWHDDLDCNYEEVLEQCKSALEVSWINSEDANAVVAMVKLLVYARKTDVEPNIISCIRTIDRTLSRYEKDLKNKDELLSEWVTYSVDSIFPESLTEYEYADDVFFGSITSESERETIARVAVDHYRDYVDAGDARGDFILEAANDVIGDDELHRRMNEI